MKRYELKLNKATTLDKFMPARYIDACGYDVEKETFPEGFNFSDLGTSFSSAFRAYKIVSNDVYEVFNEKSKPNVEYTSWGVLNSVINGVLNYLGSLWQYFQDMVVYPVRLFSSYVMYHLVVEPFVRLFTGELNDKEFWDVPNVKDQPWYHIILNTFAWVVLKVPFDIIGHVVEIIIGAALFVTSPLMILIGSACRSFKDAFFSEAKDPDNGVVVYEQIEPVSKYSLEDVNNFISHQGFGNYIIQFNDKKALEIRRVDLDDGVDLGEDLDVCQGLTEAWNTLVQERGEESGQSATHLLSQFVASIEIKTAEKVDGPLPLVRLEQLKGDTFFSEYDSGSRSKSSSTDDSANLSPSISSTPVSEASTPKDAAESKPTTEPQNMMTTEAFNSLFDGVRQ